MFVVKLVPLRVVCILEIWLYERIVMPPVNAPAMYQYTMKSVLVTYTFVCFWHEILAVADVQVELFRELVPVVNLHHGVAMKVILEALELNLKHWREIVKQNTFASILQTMAFRAVLVVAIKFFNFRIPVK